MSFGRILTPFSSANYRFYFAGQLISLLGTWMTQTATVWLVYHLTNSPLWLGAVAMLGQAPAILLSPIGGVWADRIDRLTLLKCTQVLSMFQSLVLAWVTLAGSVDVWLLTGLAMLQGVINAFDLPARQSLSMQLAEHREHLPSIIGMNSSMINMARMAGPALAGIVIAAFGAGWCFLIDGLSYLAVLAALYAVRLPRLRPAPRTGSVWQEMRDGMRYAWTFRPIRGLLLLTTAIGFFGMSYAVLIPVYAKTVFHGDGRVLGLLMSASAAGSVIAALYLATRQTIRGLDRMILLGTILAGGALSVFAFSDTLWVSLLCLVITGMGGILVFASNNTLIQNLVEETKRGRVMSIYMVAFLGGMPLGALLTGAIASIVGITAATCANAGACLLLGLAFLAWRPRFRSAAGLTPD